jgi:hypothetical protein
MPTKALTDQIASLAFIHPNREQIIKALDKIVAEWEVWSREVEQLADQPYDHNSQSEVFADGESAMQKHEILQSKTLTFLNQSITGHGFITGFDGTHCDRTDLRLRHRVKHRLQQLRILRASLEMLRSEERMPDTNPASLNTDKVWQDIKIDYDISKRVFGRKIAFVTDPFKRDVIFRDIEQAYALAKAGFAKPAVILAGSVIEELLRLFLESKGIPPSSSTFDSYIKTCVEKGLLKSAIHRLTDSVRHFRNLVHLQEESASRHTISKATAKGAVASIFTIANDFNQVT